MRLALEYTPIDELLLYASYNRGVKGGGYNAPIFPLTPPLAYDDDTMSYDPEKLDAYEIGFKYDLFGGLARLNGAAYYYDYSDYQAFQIIGIDTITTNAEGESMGFELELQAAPVDGLDLMLGLAYNDVDVDLRNGTPETTSIQSPKWNVSGLARYEWPMLWGTTAIQADFTHRSKHFFALTRLPTVTENGYTVVNASISWAHEGGHWSARVFMDNLTDEEYLVQTFDLSGPAVFGMTEQYYGRPRWAGVSVAYDF